MEREIYSVSITWMTNSGPMAAPRSFFDVQSYSEDKEGGRLILKFKHYELWLFTRHMASVKIEPVIK